MKQRASLRWRGSGWLGKADLAVFRAVARSDTPGLDRLLPRLSHAANYSRLWVLAGLLLAALGGRRGRRAALRGLLAVGLTSTTVNLPLKLALRRSRPPVDLVPEVRRLRRLPTSWSLPSGHSASAAAFATGVALELPPAGAPVGAVAAAVGYSRIYTGAHFPGDVMVGAAIGSGLALASTRWWPRAPDLHDPPPAQLRFGTVEPLGRGRGLVCCVNPDAGGVWSPGRSGTAHLDLIRNAGDVIRELLPDAEVITCAGDLDHDLETVAGRADVLGVAGGDGSVNTAAEVAHSRQVPLLVVPTGTHNHFARDVGLGGPRDALEAAQRGETVAVDLATIAGRPFLNVASVGGYASLVALRERLEDRIGKWPALLWGLLRVLREDEPLHLEIDGRPRTVWMLFAGNCRYQPHGFAPSWRTRLDDGLLDLRLVDATTPWARTRLVASVLTGRLGRCRAYEEWTAPSVHIRSLQGAVQLVRDGEVFDGPEEFMIGKHAHPLVVFAPHSRKGSHAL